MAQGRSGFKVREAVCGVLALTSKVNSFSRSVELVASMLMPFPILFVLDTRLIRGKLSGRYRGAYSQNTVWGHT